MTCCVSTFARLPAPADPEPAQTLTHTPIVVIQVQNSLRITNRCKFSASALGEPNG